MTLFERLAMRQLLVVTGKGGVGKTVVAGALGTILADLGRRVLLLEVDPRENLHQVFDVPPSGGEIVRIPPSIALQNLQPQRVIEDLVRQHLRVEMLSRRVTGNAVFQHFVEGAPGLKELAVLSHAQRVVSGQRRSPAHFDVVVLDAPATGHGVSLLAAPHLVSDVIERGPIGAEARELAAFVANPHKTGIVVVTLAEEMPAQETLELREALEEQVERMPELLVINALYPPCPDLDADRPGTDAILFELWRARRAVNERETAHLFAAWIGDILSVPMLPADRGPRLLAGVRQKMLEQVRQAA
jgi:anion-transporting  ArsA/GET3 family ATPase